MSRNPKRPTPMSADTLTLTLAAQYSRTYARNHADYQETCAAEYRLGWRPRTCEHGTNQWTEYETICGPCEDGITMADGVQRRRRALAQAKTDAQEWRAATNALRTLHNLGLLSAAHQSLWADAADILTRAYRTD